MKRLTKEGISTKNWPAVSTQQPATQQAPTTTQAANNNSNDGSALDLHPRFGEDIFVIGGGHSVMQATVEPWNKQTQTQPQTPAAAQPVPRSYASVAKTNTNSCNDSNINTSFGNLGSSAFTPTAPVSYTTNTNYTNNNNESNIADIEFDMDGEAMFGGDDDVYAQPHVMGDQPPEDCMPPLCRYHMTSSCRYGAYCHFVHGITCQACARNCIHPFDMHHVGQCIANSEGSCCICLENTLEKGRKFGVLNGCNHIFCLECIRGWRASVDRPRDSVRACPVCRTDSHFVIPFDFIPDASSKQEAVTSYKNNLASIPCKYFSYRNGTSSCPFGSSCFYAHLDQSGNKVVESVRKYVNADGEVDIVKAVRLSEFISQ